MRTVRAKCNGKHLAFDKWHDGVIGTFAGACRRTAHLLLRRGRRCLLLLLLLLLCGGGNPGRQLLEVGRVHSRPGWRRRRQLHDRQLNTVRSGCHCHTLGPQCASRR